MIGTKLCWVGLVASLAGCAFDASEGVDREDLDEARKELRHQALSKEQEATALQLIDNICGDTWCEGDHNFRFDRLSCQNECRGSAGACRLTFRVFSHDTDLETGPTYVRSCRTEGFTGFESLVSTQGSYQALQPAYYGALSECISRIEGELPLSP